MMVASKKAYGVGDPHSRFQILNISDFGHGVTARVNAIGNIDKRRKVSTNNDLGR